jgi:hypothetical protein
LWRLGKLREEAGVGELSETEKDFLTRMADKTANTEDSFYVQMNGKVVDVLWRVLRCREEVETEEVRNSIKRGRENREKRVRMERENGERECTKREG